MIMCCNKGDILGRALSCKCSYLFLIFSPMFHFAAYSLSGENCDLEPQCFQLQIDTNAWHCSWNANESDVSRLTFRCPGLVILMPKPTGGKLSGYDGSSLKFGVEYTVTVKSNGKMGTCKLLLQSSGTLSCHRYQLPRFVHHSLLIVLSKPKSKYIGQKCTRDTKQNKKMSTVI